MSLGARVAMSAAALVLLAACVGSGGQPKSSPSLAYDPGTKTKAEKLVAAAESTLVEDRYGYFSLQEDVGETFEINGQYDLAESAVDYDAPYVSSDGGVYGVQTVIVNGKGFVRPRLDDEVACWVRLDPRGGVAMQGDEPGKMHQDVPAWPRMLMHLKVLGQANDDASYIHVRVRLADVLPSLFPTHWWQEPYSVPGRVTVPAVLHVYRGKFEGVKVRMGDVLERAKDQEIDIVRDYLDQDPSVGRKIADGVVSISYRESGPDPQIDEPDLSEDIPDGHQANCIDVLGLADEEGTPT